MIVFLLCTLSYSISLTNSSMSVFECTELGEWGEGGPPAARFIRSKDLALIFIINLNYNNDGGWAVGTT